VALSERRKSQSLAQVQPYRNDLRRSAENPATTARVRIVIGTSEMPFAGHPMFGPLAWRAGRDRDGVLRFDEIGRVLVEVTSTQRRQGNFGPSPSRAARSRSAPKCRSMLPGLRGSM